MKITKIALYASCALILLTAAHYQYAEQKRVTREQQIEQLQLMQQQIDGIKLALNMQEQDLDVRFMGLDFLNTLSCDRESLDSLLDSIPGLYGKISTFLGTFLAYLNDLMACLTPCECEEEEVL